MPQVPLVIRELVVHLDFLANLVLMENLALLVFLVALERKGQKVCKDPQAQLVNLDLLDWPDPQDLLEAQEREEREETLDRRVCLVLKDKEELMEHPVLKERKELLDLREKRA